MSEMKKYGEVKGVNGQSDFYKFCGALTLQESQSWDMDDITTKLNKNYPKGAMHDSPHKNQWKAARRNIDRILDHQKLSIRRWVFTHPLMTTILGTVIGGIILTAILALTEYIGKDLTRIDPQTQTKETDRLENIPKQTPPIN